MFNGLYFRGTWATPFARQKEESFYRSDNEKITVTTMSTEGIFRAGNVPELDSVAIELPYKVPLTQHPILITLYRFSTAVKVSMLFFCVVTPCGLAGRSTFWKNILSQSSILKFTVFLRNVAVYLQVCKALERGRRTQTGKIVVHFCTCLVTGWSIFSVGSHPQLQDRTQSADFRPRWLFLKERRRTAAAPGG